jgi:hypothetical protein
MALSLEDVRRIADEVIRQENPAMQVLAATTAEGGSDYTEIIVTVLGCHTEPCRLILGLNRQASEPVFRRTVAEKFRQHLKEHA